METTQSSYSHDLRWPTYKKMPDLKKKRKKEKKETTELN